MSILVILLKCTFEIVTSDFCCLFYISFSSPPSPLPCLPSVSQLPQCLAKRRANGDPPEGGRRAARKVEPAAPLSRVLCLFRFPFPPPPPSPDDGEAPQLLTQAFLPCLAHALLLFHLTAIKVCLLVQQ